MTVKATSLLLLSLCCASGAIAKSADQCREENAHVAAEHRQQAVIDCLLAASSPLPLVEPPKPAAPTRPVKPPSLRKPQAAEVAQVRAALEDKLRDPYSAVLSDLVVLKYAGDNSLTVCGNVNAKNSFGAYVGKRPFYFAKDSAGTAFWIADANDFESSMVRTLCVEKITGRLP